jgi:hypothetical protein
MPDVGRVVILAGRRIDAPYAARERFPLARLAEVARRLRAAFRSLDAGVLICSAANGADLAALHVARELGMRRRIVLPFSVARFRHVSVVDRAGGELWGWLFDGLIAEARAAEDLIVLRKRYPDDTGAYAAATNRMIEEALGLARNAGLSGEDTLAGVVVWEGQSRGDSDATAVLVDALRDAGYPVKHISTL